MPAETASYGQQMLRLLMSYIPTRVIYVAAKLGIADRIGTDGASAEDVAQALDVNPGALYRVLRTLAGLGVLHQDEEDRFFVTPFGETLRKHSPQSVCEYAIYSHEVVYEAFRGITDCVRTGQPVFDDLFKHLRANPELEAAFHSGMSNRGRLEARAILQAYPFPGPQTVVDVGGGNGAFLSAVVSSHPETSGILLDQASAIDAARAGRGGALPRCELVVGDFFKAVPAGGDTYVLKRVLLDWTEHETLTILRNCRGVMNPNGRLLIIEPLLGARNEQSPADLFDMTFLVLLHGRLRAESEYRSLLPKAGFAFDRAIATASEVTVLVARPDSTG
jgi:hypothetical protein